MSFTEQQQKTLENAKAVERITGKPISDRDYIWIARAVNQHAADAERFALESRRAAEVSQ